MAAQNPLSGATPAAGGSLLRTLPYELVEEGVLLRAGILQLANVQTTSARKNTFVINKSAPTVGFVDEGAAKPVTTAEFGTLELNIKKLATIQVFTDELLADAQDDPTVLVNPKVETAFGQTIDAHLLGRSGGANVTSSFDSNLRQGASAANNVELGTTGDALQVAVSAAADKIFQATGADIGSLSVALSVDAPKVRRDARASTDPTIYVPQDLYGMEVAYSSNLDLLAPAGAGKIVGVVGDFSKLHVRVLDTLQVKASDVAGWSEGATVHSAFQENKTLIRYEMRIGSVIEDPDAFSLIINAA